MTDTLHKSSFPSMCLELKFICFDINNNKLINKLYTEPSFNNNYEFIASKLSQFISSKFKQATKLFMKGYIKYARNEDEIRFFLKC